MPTFATAIARLDQARDAFLAALDALPEAGRDFRPPDGGWSPHDVAEHLMLVERGLVGGLERQIAAGDARRDVGPPSEEALDALVDGLASERRYRIPDTAAPYIAPDGTHAEHVRGEWAAIAARWHRLAETMPEALAAIGLVRHPYIGAVTAEGAARFAGAHVRHHHAQLDRIVASEGFPA